MDLGAILALLELVLIGLIGWNLHETISTGKAIARIEVQLADHERRLDVLEAHDEP